MIRTILRDFAGIVRVCGLGTGLHWLAMIALHFPRCYREKTLQSADRAMGDGPFRVSLNGRSKAVLQGDRPFGGVRELWVRNVYLRNDYLTIKDHDLIVDIGSHRGMFTLMALGHGPNVRSVAVEASPKNVEMLRRELTANGWEKRCDVCTAFLGNETSYQQEMKSHGGAAAVATLSEADFVERYKITKIDLLKVDIEGSEYGLLTPQSKLLAMARQLTLEAHDFAGKPEALAQMLGKLGFEMSEPIIHSGCWLIQARRKG